VSVTVTGDAFKVSVTVTGDAFKQVMVKQAKRRRLALVRKSPPSVSSFVEWLVRFGFLCLCLVW
jgi:hypothetical protein